MHSAALDQRETVRAFPRLVFAVARPQQCLIWNIVGCCLARSFLRRGFLSSGQALFGHSLTVVRLSAVARHVGELRGLDHGLTEPRWLVVSCSLEGGPFDR